MKKNLFCVWLAFFAILFSVNMHAQMTIGGKKEPEAFSVLELLNKGGLRLPQMSTAERDAFAVQGNDKGSGLTIYNKTTGCVEYWNKTRWVSLCDDTSVNALIAADNGLTATNGKVQLGGALLKSSVITTTAANTLSVQGLQAGSTADNVLVADANGVLKWVTRASFVTPGDNLGNHTATQDLAMSGKNIANAANITATGTITGANVTATTKTTTPAAQITTGAGLGKVAVSDASGNLTWTDPATITAKGDNLGNHTATQNLDMSGKNINNINSAFVKTEVEIADRGTGNTSYFGLDKYNGNLQIFNSSKSTIDLSINESTRKTTVNNLAINAGTDGVAPAAGYVATSADANGNVVWKSAASLGAGDNLGNHTATQDLAMSGKNIANAANVTATGTVTGANITATTKTTTPAAQITTGAGLGKVAVSDAAGNVTWTDPTTITAKGDNLGNHTATQDLDMSTKNINNVNNIYVKNDAQILDRTTSNTKYFGLYKDNGVFKIWNSSKSTNPLMIDEATDKTTLSTAAISKGTDGVAPAAGYVATSADANGNVVWKSAASLGAGDNLGNHTATQDLAMSGKNIANAANVTATGTVTGANITATTKTTTPAAQITTGAGLGKVAVSDAAGNVTWTDPTTITTKGDNLGNHTATQDLVMSSKNITGATNVTATGTVTGANITATTKTTTPAAQITTGAGAGKVAVSDASGNLTWTDPATITAKGDNLGNHTATQDLDMSSKNINNINVARIKSEATFADRSDAANTNTFNFYKSNGIFKLWNSSKNLDLMTFNENNNVWINGPLTLSSTLTVNNLPAGTASESILTSDASGNVHKIAASSIGDNLGNHTATKDLDMASKNINKIATASVDYQLKINDVTTTNTKYTSLWKKDGVFGIWNQGTGKNDLAIDETSGKTTLTGAAISKGTDGVAPAAGYIATSADANGNVVWKSAASIGAGDNLGNHIATQNLDMSSKNIQNINNAYIKNEAQILDRTTSNTNYFGLYKSNGSFGIYNSSKGQNAFTIAETTGNVGIGLGGTAASNALHVKAAADPLKLEGLATSSLGTESALIVGADGVVKKTPQPLPRRALYSTGNIAPGESKTITLDFSADTAMFTVTVGNNCGRTAIANLVTSNNVISFAGGQARDILYKAAVLDANGNSLAIKSVSGVTGCSGDGGATQFDFDIQKTGTTIVITNRGDVNRWYNIKQNEL
ncbi:hypothetical protein [Flavobacterium sp.]|uniref:beta strand repeat-containing protein n=1 Tax=Flavobacterium sp. TaxID=239 RepID=UPI0031DF8188